MGRRRQEERDLQHMPVVEVVEPLNPKEAAEKRKIVEALRASTSPDRQQWKVGARRRQRWARGSDRFGARAHTARWADARARRAGPTRLRQTT